MVMVSGEPYKTYGGD